MSNESAASGARILSGHQPDFMPWLGVFYKIRNSDVLRISDHVQYTNSWTNRVKIKGESGKAEWITIPIAATDHRLPICEVKIASGVDWKPRLLGKIHASYRRAPHYGELAEVLETIRAYEGGRLQALNMQLLRLTLKNLNVETRVVLGSELGLDPGKTMHIVDSCRKLGCSIYLAGQGAEYLDESLFAEHGLQLRRSRFVHPVYPQPGLEFVPGLSVLDAIANLGWARTSDLIAGEKQIYE